MTYHLTVKPTGAACNLACDYCFYLSKDRLYPGRSHLMSEETLALYLRQLLASSGAEATVAWQGGEPMLHGLEFFRRAVALAEKHRRPGQTIRHTIQTNGTLITDEWAAHFRDHDYLVGLSLDGPEHLHDAYRVDKKGRGTFGQAVRGWNILQAHGVATNILCTLHAGNAACPLDIYRFFRDELGAAHIQFIPIVERATRKDLDRLNGGWDDRPLYRQEGRHVSDRSVTAEQFGAFLIAVFDEWREHDVGRVFVSQIETAAASWRGVYTNCTVAPHCGAALAMERNGDVYACDHFVEPKHRLGNIRGKPLGDMAASAKQRRFGRAKFDTLPRACRECPFLFACYGECPKNRFIETADGEPGLNWLCAGYKAFFAHIASFLERKTGRMRPVA